MTPEEIEISLLCEAIFLRYGCDFRQYSRGTMERRIRQRVELNNLGSVAELQHQVLHDSDLADLLFKDLSINVTEMFRDPEFYRAVRNQVLPELRDQPHFKIWHAGCASGEEVYSMAILLSEEGIYDKARLYGTDFNNEIVEVAKRGVMPLSGMRKNSENYTASGSTGSFSDYFHSNYDSAILNSTLGRNIVFANHNLTTDASFGELQMIVCRNVMIYFNPDLQERVFQLFTDSLCLGGILCLGMHETLNLSSVARQFEEVSIKQKIYRKIG